MFITFTYNIGKNRYFGKYHRLYSSHGLDVIIKSMLQRALEAYKEKHNLR